MAKGRSRFRAANAVGATRSRYVIANPRLSAPVSFSRPLDLLAIEDRRTFHPARMFRAPLSVSRRAFAKVVARPNRALHRETFSFAVPQKVALCVRRKERREVLHALKRTRSGGGRSKRRNAWSAVKC